MEVARNTLDTDANSVGKGVLMGGSINHRLFDTVFHERKDYDKRIFTRSQSSLFPHCLPLSLLILFPSSFSSVPALFVTLPYGSEDCHHCSFPPYHHCIKRYITAHTPSPRHRTSRPRMKFLNRLHILDALSVPQFPFRPLPSFPPSPCLLPLPSLPSILPLLR